MNDDSENHDLIDELVSEFLNRRLAGETPTISEYCRRHPVYESQIREIFPMLDLLENIKPENSHVDTEPVEHPELIGEYKIVREIGHGGMGVVYEAEHRELGRRVALKVIGNRISHDDQARVRFQREARAVSKMHHTNIVPLFDVGEDEGRSYFSMQLIHGQSLDQIISSMSKGATKSASTDRPKQDTVKVLNDDETDAVLHKSTVDSFLFTSQSSSSTGRRRRFEWIARIGSQSADALHYAHQRGIIHRDVKPSNLILDSSGQVWLTDFGLAKTDDEEFTQAGDLLGTLRYMAPERFQGNCDERADVYGLGLVLYELLTLKPAFQSSDRLKLIDRICREKPVRIANLNPQVPRDLETIVLKACDGDPSSRYQTAMEFCEDLRGFLADEPIKARRASVLEQTMRWARRNKQLAGSLFATAALLILFAVGLSAALYREAGYLNESEIAKQRLQRKLYAYEIQRADAAYLANNLDEVRRCLNGCPEDLRGWEWNRYNWLARPKQLHTIRGGKRPIFTAEGKHLITAGRPDSSGAGLTQRERNLNKAMVWDLSTGELFGAPMSGPDGLSSFVLTPDGKHLVGGLMSGQVVSWDMDSREQVWKAKPHVGKIDGIAISADGQRIATVSWDQTLKILDVKTGELLLNIGPTGHRLRCVEFSPSGEQVAAAGHQSETNANADFNAKVWNAHSGDLLFELDDHAGPTSTVAYSPDGQQLITGGQDGLVRRWNATNGAELQSCFGHDGAVTALAFAPDGATFTSSGQDGTIRIWNARTNEEITRYRTGQPSVWLSYDRGGDRIAEYGGKRVRVWDAESTDDVFFLRHGGNVKACEFSPDGKQIASCGNDGTIKIWRVATGQLLHVLHGHELRVNALAWHPKLALIASTSSDQTVRIWDTDTGRLVATLPVHGKNLFPIDFSRDGTKLACGAFFGSVSVFDVTTHQLVREIATNSGVRSLRWMPGDEKLIVGLNGAAATIFDVASGQVAPTMGGDESKGTLTRDGDRLVAGHPDGTILIRDQRSGVIDIQIGGRVGPLHSFAISPDGQRLAACVRGESVVKIWDTNSGVELTTLHGHQSLVRDVSFSPDGLTIASASDDGTIAVWESIELAELRQTRSQMSRASRLVDGLFDQHTFAKDVVAALAEDESLDPVVRDLALQVVSKQGDNAVPLFRESWEVNLSLDRNIAAAELAWRKADAACSQVPDSTAFRTALGVADYRLGRYEEALENLSRARAAQLARTPIRNLLNIGPGIVPDYPVNLAFTAMTLHRLNRKDEAKEELKQLEPLLKESTWTHFRSVIYSRREAARLIRGR